MVLVLDVNFCPTLSRFLSLSLSLILSFSLSFFFSRLMCLCLVRQPCGAWSSIRDVPASFHRPRGRSWNLRALALEMVDRLSGPWADLVFGEEAVEPAVITPSCPLFKLQAGTT